jgi:predicted oxidoreductase
MIAKVAVDKVAVVASADVRTAAAVKAVAVVSALAVMAGTDSAITNASISFHNQIPAHTGIFFMSNIVMKPLKFTSSPVIAGCMRWGQWGANMDFDQMRSMIEGCLSMGIDTFDHADIYGGPHATESLFGAVIGERSSLREKIKIITKCGILLPDKTAGFPRIKHYNTSTEYIIRSAEQSLHALKTDHIDLLLIHRPDPLMHPGEVAEAFFQLQRDGKVLRFGVSNFKGAQLRMFHKHWPVSVNQLQVSIEHPQALFDGSIDTCMELGVDVQAWSPIGGGLIKAESDDERLRKIFAVAEIIAHKYGCQVSQVLLAWVQNHPCGIVPVIGSGKLDRISAAVGSVSLKLDREEWFMLLRASTGRDVA